MKELVGKRVSAIWVNEDQSILRFDTDHGTIVYEAWGDCCSECWFADITGVIALIGGVVTGAEQVDLDDAYNVDDGRCRQVEDSAYGWKLKTDKGYVDIVYRNSSNGYYGGSISLIDGAPQNMTPITDDWRA